MSSKHKLRLDIFFVVVVVAYLTHELTGLLRLPHVQRLRGLPADAFHPVQIGPVLLLHKQQRTSVPSIDPICPAWSESLVLYKMFRNQRRTSLCSP